jgi:hypothetical protein
LQQDQWIDGNSQNGKDECISNGVMKEKYKFFTIYVKKFFWEKIEE